jgi:hypothetical protein
VLESGFVFGWVVLWDLNDVLNLYKFHTGLDLCGV